METTFAGRSPDAMPSQLCDTCLALQLTVEKFTRAVADNQDIQPTAQSLRNANERVDYGSLSEVQDRANACALCKLITQSFYDNRTGSTTRDTGDFTCLLRWEIDGRPSVDGVGRSGLGGTRRLRICWRGSTKSGVLDSYIVLGAPGDDFEVNENYRDRLSSENQFLGRRVGPASFKRNLIRQFLRLCERDHDRNRCSRNLGNEDPFAYTLRQPYFGVIDIENECLIPLPFNKRPNEIQFSPYATVSYVWGAHRDYKTNMSNVQGRRQNGGLVDTIPKLPKSLRDSIQLTRSLGIHYIWIDALCIVQDSRQSWMLNSRVMDQIYGNSTLTICAADGDDGSQGLLALEQDSQPEQRICEYAKGVRLLLHQPPEAHITNSQWNKRAWTFQERLLSKCCVIFTGRRIYFQCRSACLSEDIFAEKGGNGWSLDLVHAPLQLLFEHRRRSLWFYTQCVQLYTRRQLYEPFDILAAFYGMCRLMEGSMRAPFIFGLPTSHFDFALLWVPTGASKRLIIPSSIEKKYEDMSFPSWSWSGWKGLGVQYESDLVDGCLQNVSSWLASHTWIDWHIRDAYGTLRRIWDATESFIYEDVSSDQRWRGYRKRLWRGGDKPEGGNMRMPPENISSRSSESVDYYSSDGSFIEYKAGGRYRDNPGRGRYGNQKVPTPRRDIRHETPSRYVREETNAISLPPLQEDLGGGPPTPLHGPRPVQFGPLPAPKGTARATGDDRARFLLKRRNETIRNHRVHYKGDRVADNYGRLLLGTAVQRVPPAASSPFKLTLPEYPYAVNTSNDSQGASGVSNESPNQPFLQFFTWRAPFHIVRTSTEDDQSLDAGLSRCHITDSLGDKCGSVVVDAAWLRSKEEASQTRFEFVAVSEAKSFTRAEFPDWTYFIPKEREESEWDLFFVLLVEYYKEEGVYRRVALGKMFQAAFTRSTEEWKEIILSRV